MANIKYIIVHHTAISFKKNPDQFVAINNYHKEKWNNKSSLGYYGGYNYLITANGELKQYRKEGEETVAVVGHNFDSIHVALCGNFDLEMPTKRQILTLEGLLKQKTIRYAILVKNIVPHRKFAAKSCFGELLSDDWAQNLLIGEKKITILRAIVEVLQKLIKLLT